MKTLNTTPESLSGRYRLDQQEQYATKLADWKEEINDSIQFTNGWLKFGRFVDWAFYVKALYSIGIATYPWFETAHVVFQMLGVISVVVGVIAALGFAAFNFDNHAVNIEPRAWGPFSQILFWLVKLGVVRSKPAPAAPNLAVVDLTNPDVTSRSLELLVADTEKESTTLIDSIDQALNINGVAIHRMRAVLKQNPAEHVKVTAQGALEALETQETRLYEQKKRAETVIDNLRSETKRHQSELSMQKDIMDVHKVAGLISKTDEMLIRNEEILLRVEGMRNDAVLELKSINEVLALGTR